MLFRIVNFVVPDRGRRARLVAGPDARRTHCHLGGHLVLVCFDLWRGNKVVSWLKVGDTNHTPHLWGLWGEAIDRARRLVRSHEKMKNKPALSSSRCSPPCRHRPMV